MRLIALVLFLFSIQTNIWSQGASDCGPTFSFSSTTVVVDEEFCIEVKTKDFTNLIEVRLPIKWNPNIIEFIQVKDFSREMTGLDISDFDVSKTDSGYLVLNWKFQDCEAGTNSVTIPSTIEETEVLFRICFKMIGGYGGFSFIEVDDETNVPVAFRRLSAGLCTGICFFEERGIASSSVRPFRIKVDDEITNSDDRFCTSVTVEGFDNMNSVQFSLNWDSTLLKFEEIIPSDSLQGLSLSTNFSFKVNSIAFLWFFDPASPGQGITLSPGSEIFKTCFTAIAPCGQVDQIAKIQVSDQPTAIEVSNVIAEGQPLGVVLKDGEVTIRRCDPNGLKLVSDCPPPVELNQVFCIPIKAGDNFINIKEMQYLMKWNSSILTFTEVKSVHPQLSSANFDPSNAVNGILGVNWSNSSLVSLPEGTVLYELCFRVTGLGGDSPITFGGNGVVRDGTIFPRGLNPTNCLVEVKQPAGLVFIGNSLDGFQNEEKCVDFIVNNFQNINVFKAGFAWDPTIIDLLSIKDYGLPELNEGEVFNVDQLANGVLQVDWNFPAGASLANGSKAFSLCFKLVGFTETCSPIFFEDLFSGIPFVSNIGSNGLNIGVEIQEPEICILNPPGYTLLLGNYEAFPKDTLCVPILVEDFSKITQTAFTLNWDPEVLNFVSYNDNSNLLGDSIFTASTQTGVLGYQWIDPTGKDLPDSTVLFEVCFEIPSTSIRKCSPLSIISLPNPAVGTLLGDGSLNFKDGEICVKDRFVIKSLEVSQVTCPGLLNGSAELEFEGGTPPVFVQWSRLDGTFIESGKNPTKLPQGDVVLLIVDTSGTFLLDTISIPLADSLPFANAGNDFNFNCASPLNPLNGTGTLGSDYSYSWSTEDGAISQASNSLSIFITRGGEYILTVTKKSTGCSVSDTVFVADTERPIAFAGDDQFFTCSETSFTIDGSGSSSQGSNLRYLWTSLPSGLIPSGSAAKPSFETSKPGNYILRVINDLNCSSVDTISIIDQTTPPIAKAGEDLILPCGFSFLLKGDSSQSSFGYPLSFDWSSLSKDTQSFGSDFSVSKTGTYILEVTDEVTGCVASDTVLVKPDSLDPQIELNVDNFELNCKNPEFSLEAKVLRSSTYTLEWSTTNPSGFANPSGTSLNRTIIAPGIYTLNVDIENSPCSLTQSIEVTENFNLPVAGISSSADTITCYNPEITLSIIDFTPDSFYLIEWYRDGQIVASDSLEIHIQQGGNYKFVITDTINGCANEKSIFINENLDALRSPFFLVLTASNDGILDCEKSSLDLSILNLPISQSEFSINWETDSGNITSIADFFTARVNKPGNYKAILTNLNNGCSEEKAIIVTTNAVLPTAIASVDGKITCSTPQRQLNSVGSSFGTNFSYTWKNQTSGTNVSNDVVADVTEPGAYILNILNTENSCSASDTIEVEIDTTAPFVIIQEPEILTCEKDTLILNATGTDFNLDYTYSWSGLDNQTVITANNPLLVQIVAGGSYQLSVKNNQNGCTGSQIIDVEVDQDFPQANPGPQKILECIDIPVTLDGSGSSVGVNFSYTWSAISGGSMLSNPSILSPQVTQPGIYKLVVTNTLTGCSSEATVSVILNPELVLAMATGPTDIICESEATVMGNLPSGTTGLWRKISPDPILSNPELATTAVSALVPGNNLFEWSLSVANCSNYSKDTVNVEVAKAPIASDDALQLTNGLTMATINVLANDLISGQEYSLSLLKSPDVGKVTAIESGSPQYSVRGGYFGEDFFTYLLCNELCENLCDTATVFIDIPFDEDYKAPPLPNAITPNGDGLNDFLEFELLEDSGTIYPDNELIIFNRWGDIVFRARPYNNDWSGRGNDGKELPHATYYYVLRLNISEGIILKGDVTILQRN